MTAMSLKSMLWLTLIAGCISPIRLAHAETDTLASIVASGPAYKPGKDAEFDHAYGIDKVRCGYTQWGQICAHGGLRYSYSGKYGRSDITETQFARYLTRCNAQAKLLHVNDALYTGQEIFDRCMVGELTRAE